MFIRYISLLTKYAHMSTIICKNIKKIDTFNDLLFEICNKYNFNYNINQIFSISNETCSVFVTITETSRSHSINDQYLLLLEEIHNIRA